jgi:hypothetical protein
MAKVDDDEARRLMSAYNAAWKRVSVSTGKTAQGAEAAYGQAYQALVRAGLAPQIKQKYRRS